MSTSAICQKSACCIDRPVSKILSKKGFQKAKKQGSKSLSISCEAAQDNSGVRRLQSTVNTTKANSVDQLHKLQAKDEEEYSFDDKNAAAASIRNSLQSASGSANPTITLGRRHKRQVPNVRELLGSGATVDDQSLSFTKVNRNFSPAQLIEKALATEKGSFLLSTGALATLSGAKTGRSPKDKRVVKDSTSEDVWWGPGSPNVPIDEDTFLKNRERALDYLHTRDEIYVVDGFAGWEPESRVAVRIVCARPYHAMFIQQLLIRPIPEDLKDFTPDITIYNAGAFPCNRYTNGMSSSTSVDVSLERREMVILGTMYAGEMKKGVFTMMQYLMPKCGILSMHAGCNIGKDNDVSLFFGLSGTGKTTLSTDPVRPLIGDDEHCWSENGVFNIEGGCYAKCIDLNPKLEPEIHKAIKFGAILENVVFTKNTRQVDYHDCSVTENTRAAYPIEHIENSVIPCVGPHPKNIILLCCDAFGVLPPVSKLTKSQAMYHFISGYTAKVAGTEVGITEPEATFSACFGSAFLVMHPYRYAALLADKMEQHSANAWLVNTGWTGGRYGVGNRMKLSQTRAIIDAIHSGELENAPSTHTAVFNLEVPLEVTGVPSDVLVPEVLWEDKEEFASTLQHLGELFNKNFEKFQTGGDMIGQDVVDEIRNAAPQVDVVVNV
eukprot:CAMPEP_0196580756 /NCGR_PEP_ID=MMETSP1081-20130531/30435_1 /TAXON_ID=36882 /ORGANISM="Pyramimonas amylifera, Strain CCMP720" /LENGTH=664 /DNA_ID=CAMNT_0041900727 /DNA_START=38 /DNA_END=2032 /DNA_ORIENTATION=-